MRPVGNPTGDESNPRISIGNRLWRRTIALATQATRLGIPVVIEHPRGSKAWQMPETKTLLNDPNFKLHSVDWCMYYDGGAEDARANKPTRLLSSAPWVSQLCCTCDHSHSHLPPLLHGKAQSHSAYPIAFCRAFAAAYSSWVALAAQMGPTGGPRGHLRGP